jgi:hypothetical protein
MSVLNKLSETSKGKLKLLQAEVNSIRPSCISDNNVIEWYSLNITERKRKIRVHLSMSLLSEKNFEVIFNRINPRWGPYVKFAWVILITVLTAVIIQSIRYISAERLYLMGFEANIPFKDGQSISYKLFDRNATLIIKGRTTDNTYYEDNYLQWLFGKGRQVSSIDTTLWTRDKNEFEKIKILFGDFKSDSYLVEFSKFNINPIKLFKAINSFINVGPLHLDLTVPSKYQSDYSSILIKADLGNVYLYCTVKSANEYFNLKIEILQNGSYIIREIKDTSGNTWRANKILWVKNKKVRLPELLIIEKNNGLKIYQYRSIDDSLVYLKYLD